MSLRVRRTTHRPNYMVQRQQADISTCASDMVTSQAAFCAIPVATSVAKAFDG